MRKIFLSAIMALNISIALSQSAAVDWAERTGGAWWYYFTGVKSIATDAAGNTYTAGTFTDTADFDPGPGVHTLVSFGYSDGYIVKTAPNGNFIWVKQFRNTNVMSLNSVKVDAAGNIYAAGYFDGITDFDPGPDSLMMQVVAPELSIYDSYVLKLNSNGDLVWAKQFGGPYSEYALSMSVDPSGNSYTSGFFGGIADFDPGSGVFNLDGGAGISSFILKLDANGNFSWASRLGDGDLLNGYVVTSWGISADAFGNVYGTGQVDSSGVLSAYVIKLNTNGTKLWQKIMSPGAIGRSITTDPSGNVITIGDFFDVTDFDPGPGVYSPTPPNTGGSYVSKLDANGNFVWAKVLYGNLSNDGSGYKTKDVKTDASGNIYAGFTFLEKIGTNPGPSGNEQYAPGGERNILILKLLPNGNFNWTKNLGGCGYDELREMALDNSGHIYFTGAGNNFDQITLSNNGNFFICKLSQNASLPPTGVNLSGRIWNDLNKNGIDNNEPPIVNFRVILYKDDNNNNLPDDCYFASVQSDSAGNYSFANLVPGNYIVGVALPVTRDYTKSPVNGGDPDNNIDKDNNGTIYFEYPDAPNYEPEVRGYAITLTPGQEPGGNTNTTYDIGLVRGQLCLGNRVWNDVNRNGKDNNEPGLAGLNVILYKVPNSNDPISAGIGLIGITTDLNGKYSFCNLLPGHYIVYVEMPEGFQTSKKNGGDPDNNKDKDNNGYFKQPGAVWGLPITLTDNGEPQGNINNTYDIGLHPIHNDDDDDDEGENRNASKMSGVNEKSSRQPVNINSIYPNPFSSQVKVTLNSETACMASVRILSTTGSVMYNGYQHLSAGINTFSLGKLDRIPAGLYILEVRTKDNTMIQKIIKQ